MTEVSTKVQLHPESLIPNIGVEQVAIGNAPDQPKFVRVPLNGEPLFEVDGIKALAKITIAPIPGEAAEDTYYIADVSELDASRVGEDGTTEKIDYMVVKHNFFSNSAAREDNRNYASVRIPSKKNHYNSPDTVVGGAYNSTRFPIPNQNGFRVYVQDVTDPKIVIDMPYYGMSGFDVTHMRDNTDPANLIKTYNEQKAVGGASTRQEQAERTKSARKQFTDTVVRSFKRDRNSSFHYSAEMKYSPSTGHSKEIYDELVGSDIMAVEDLCGFDPSNADRVYDNLQSIEYEERKAASSAITEELKNQRKVNGIGSLATLGATFGLAYLDAKMGGALATNVQHNPDNSIQPIDAVATLTAGCLASAYAKFGLAFERARALLKQGLDQEMPEVKQQLSHSEVPETTEELIRSVADQHRSFLVALDEAAHKL